MTKRRVRFTFPVELHSEPIIYTLGQQFKLVTTIYQADLAEDRGWVALELDGTDQDIEDGIAWAMSKGVRVDAVGDR